jgi:peptidoglycan/xylan/chitin deacetylase (PgdA/CDA1 family)
MPDLRVGDGASPSPARRGGLTVLLHRQAPILMYHRLTRQTGTHPFSLAVGRFRRQLTLLHALGYRSVSPVAFLDPATLPARAVALTFDDGYLDTLTVALPLLREFGFTATCYLVADMVGGHADWTESAPLMDWAGVAAWLAAGMDIGAHSLTHADLTTLAGARLREEVGGAKARLEDRLGIAVRSFAYPFNRVNPRVLSAVGEAGYAVGVAGPEIRRSPYALSRVDGAHESWAWFAVGLLPRYPALRGAYRILLPRRAA